MKKIFGINRMTKIFVVVFSVLYISMPIHLHAQTTQVGPSWEGRDYPTAIQLGNIVGHRVVEDIRDTREYANSYEGKAMAVFYSFNILGPTDILVDRLGSEEMMSQYGHISLIKCCPSEDPYLQERYSDVLDLSAFLEMYGEYLSPERYEGNSVQVWGFLGLEPGEYYLIASGPSGNAGGTNGIQQVNMFCFAPPAGKSFENPIDLGAFQDDVDIFDIRPFTVSHENNAESSVIYRFETLDFMTLYIDNDYYKASNSDFTLLDNQLNLFELPSPPPFENVMKVNKWNGSICMCIESLPPGIYYLVNKSDEPKGEIVTRISSDHSRMPGADMYNPICMGSYSRDFVCDYTYDHRWYRFLQLQSDKPSVFFKVTLRNNMDLNFRINSALNDACNITLFKPDGPPIESIGANNVGYYNLSRGDYFIAVTPLHYRDKIKIQIEGNIFLKKDNYILSSIPRKATLGMQDLNPDEILLTYRYIDGWGRTKQQIGVNASPSRRDIVSFSVYDKMGRSDATNYLPYVADQNRGTMVDDPLTEQQNYYAQKFAGDADAEYAYAVTEYQASSLGLPLNSRKPGATRHAHPVIYEYGINKSTDHPVRKYTIVNDSLLRYETNYTAGTLTVKGSYLDGDSTDQKHYALEYTNALGQLVAKEARISDDDRRITYYVYDEMGRQRYIIPPIQNNSMNPNKNYTPNELKQYCYYMEYDKYGNVIRQMVPGMEGYTLSIYNKLGQLVMSQSPNMRHKNQWSATKYDRYKRPVYSAIYTTTQTESQLRTAVAGLTDFFEQRADNVLGYTNTTFPQIDHSSNVLSVTYYDDYDWLSGADYAFRAGDALGNAPTTNGTVGLVTGTRTKVLEGADTWITTVPYYDDQYRTIQSVSDLYPSGKEIVSNAHNFVGAVVQTKVRQEFAPDDYYEYNKWFNFDSRGRLVNVEQEITGDTENGKIVLVSYEYGDMGQVTSKWVHNQLDETTYTYNITGGTTAVNSDTFSYKLGFEEDIHGNASRYDGNLDHVIWQHGNGVQQAYTLGYDALGQILSAGYRETALGSWSQDPLDKRSVSGIGYDPNGNMLSVLRNDHTGNILHDLTFTHRGNQLLTVNDGTVSPEFRYDPNGNMIEDGGSGVEVEYNILDLPERIFDGLNEIRYIYDASGQKLASVANGSFTYYRSVMVYDHANRLSHMVQPEGIVTNDNGTFVYRYFKTDHLGSTRAVLAAIAGAMIVDQTTDYYPYGLAWSTDNLHLNKYLFSGKELQDGEMSPNILGWYDFGARYYNPVYGRWFNVDPALQLANPYLYCGNSPMIYIDPDGRVFWFVPMIIGAAIGAGISAVVYTVQIACSDGGFSNWNWGQFGISVGIGALGGAVGGAVGSVVSKSFAVQAGFWHGAAVGASAGAAGGFTSGSVGSWVMGEPFEEGLKQGFIYAGIGAGMGGVIGGAVGGIQAHAKGLDFWSGEATVKPNPTTAIKVDPKQLPGAKNEPQLIEYKPADKVALETPSNAPSERVQRVLEQIDEIKSEGGTVKINPTQSNQELNMTIKHPSGKVDLRIETHPLPAKYGGQPGVPIRHMNVDVYRPYPTALPLPQPLYQPTNSYHIVL